MADLSKDQHNSDSINFLVLQLGLQLLDVFTVSGLGLSLRGLKSRR